jgi:hypothetical protein
MHTWITWSSLSCKVSTMALTESTLGNTPFVRMPHPADTSAKGVRSLSVPITLPMETSQALMLWCEDGKYNVRHGAILSRQAQKYYRKATTSAYLGFTGFLPCRMHIEADETVHGRVSKASTRAPTFTATYRVGSSITPQGRAWRRQLSPHPCDCLVRQTVDTVVAYDAKSWPD